MFELTSNPNSPKLLKRVEIQRVREDTNKDLWWRVPIITKLNALKEKMSQSPKQATSWNVEHKKLTPLS